MNGAEIIIRPTLIDPAVMNGMWELQNRALAMFNQAYVVAPNLGPEIRNDGGIIDLFGGQSMIVDYRGQIIAQQRGWTRATRSSALLDIEALRRFRSQRPVQPVQGPADRAVRARSTRSRLPEEPVPRCGRRPRAGWRARSRPARRTSRR